MGREKKYPLEAPAPELPESVELAYGLDAFGDAIEPQVAREREDALCNRAIERIVDDV
jgi:hypothetical protein